MGHPHEIHFTVNNHPFTIRTADVMALEYPEYRRQVIGTVDIPVAATHWQDYRRALEAHNVLIESVFAEGVENITITSPEPRKEEIFETEAQWEERTNALLDVEVRPVPEIRS